MHLPCHILPHPFSVNPRAGLEPPMPRFDSQPPGRAEPGLVSEFPTLRLERLGVSGFWSIQLSFEWLIRSSRGGCNDELGDLKFTLGC